MSGGNFDTVIGELTKYRRVIRRKNKDNETLGIIFNDYMNCLWADTATEKELSLIDAAAEAGCDYFCIDAGWLLSIERFPNGLKEVIDYIRGKNIILDVWIELEVMGLKCPKAERVNHKLVL